MVWWVHFSVPRAPHKPHAPRSRRTRGSSNHCRHRSHRSHRSRRNRCKPSEVSRGCESEKVNPSPETRFPREGREREGEVWGSHGKGMGAPCMQSARSIPSATLHQRCLAQPSKLRTQLLMVLGRGLHVVVRPGSLRRTIKITPAAQSETGRVKAKLAHLSELSKPKPSASEASGPGPCRPKSWKSHLA